MQFIQVGNVILNSAHIVDVQTGAQLFGDPNRRGVIVNLSTGERCQFEGNEATALLRWLTPRTFDVLAYRLGD